MITDHTILLILLCFQIYAAIRHFASVGFYMSDRRKHRRAYLRAMAATIQEPWKDGEKERDVKRRIIEALKKRESDMNHKMGGLN